MSDDPMTSQERRELAQFVRQYARSVKTRGNLSS